MPSPIYAQVWAFLHCLRTTTVAISQYINSARYSNAPTLATEPVVDPSLFDISLPVVLTPDMTHLKLSQLFARLADRSV